MFQYIYQQFLILYEKLGLLATPIEVFLKSVCIFIVTGIAVKLGRRFIKKVFKQRQLVSNVSIYKLNDKRMDTLTSITASIYSYVVYIVAVISVLTYVTRALHLESLLAAAGIGGIALGFSAQNSIRDMLAGIYILFDDPFSVGDYITVEGVSGTVSDVGLRVTKMKLDNGDLFVIANGDIRKLSNQTRGSKALDVDIPLAYKTDYKKAVSIANDICVGVKGEFDFIEEGPKVLGITEMSKEGYYNLKIIGKTVAGMQWNVERRVRELILERYVKEGIAFAERNPSGISSFFEKNIPSVNIEVEKNIPSVNIEVEKNPSNINDSVQKNTGKKKGG